MKPATDAEMKQAVLEAALAHAGADGFNDATLARAGIEAEVGAETLQHLFPQGAASLVEEYSLFADAAMERALPDLAGLKVRERIRTAVLARIDALKPHKEAARRAAAFLMLPTSLGLATTLIYRTVDSIWRAAGDKATDFNYYTKRAILAGVYTSTLMRWFNDTSDDERETKSFLDARIENVMQFEKVKAELKSRFSAPSAT
ncbi:MAG TPA: COQ9 family protein [Rhizomicrobium sp.]|nr:COQ9 family protein [Rhizomicrobium sp.]